MERGTSAAFFAGSLTSCTRQALLRLAADFPPSFVIRGPEVSHDEFREYASRSRFCLVPDGHVPNTLRLLEVMLLGCAPVVISARLRPPAHRLLNWSAFAVFVPDSETALAELPATLAARAPVPEGALAFAANVLDALDGGGSSGL